MKYLIKEYILKNGQTHSFTPLHKKGNPNNPNNYRGISLSDVSGKLFSTTINRRLQMWVDMNNTNGEQQAGFRKDYSTVDHIFTLLAIVQKQLSLNRKLYVTFIDFQKAFDSISRKLLWPTLQKQGIHGKLFRCVKSIYDVVKARVRDGASLTESIHCLRGVKQGDVFCFAPCLSSITSSKFFFYLVFISESGSSSIFSELFLYIPPFYPSKKQVSFDSGVPLNLWLPIVCCLDMHALI